MIQHLNRLYVLLYILMVYVLLYILMVYVLYAGLHHVLGLTWDNSLVWALGTVVLLILAAHAGFHVSAFVLAGSVRRVPQVKHKMLGFQLAQKPDGYKLSVSAWLKAVALETRDSFYLTTFRQPRARHYTGIRLADRQWRKSKPLPVLMVHGYLCNAGVWGDMRHLLDQQNISTHAITLEPAIGSIRRYARQIDQAIDELIAATGAPQVKLICHSMGGVAARYWATVYGHDRVHSALTLGSPHYGTALSLLGIGKNVKQMAWGSFFLRSLREHPIDREFQEKITSIWSAHDTIVSPPESCVLEYGRNIRIDSGCGHLRLILAEQTLSELNTWLYDPVETYYPPLDLTEQVPVLLDQASVSLNQPALTKK